MPREGKAPAFAQIYIHDGTAEAELENNLLHLGEASLLELRDLQLILHDYNPISLFRQGVDLKREQVGADVKILIRAEGAPDTRSYNAPTAPKVGVAMSSEGYGQ